MKRTLYYHLLITLLTLSLGPNLHADITKGQKAYIKNCKICHGSSIKASYMHTQVEWEELFANNGAKIKQAHLNNEKASIFFQTDLFNKDYKDIRDFFFYSAFDSDE